MAPSRHTGETLERSLRALLDHHPEAAIAAVGPNGRFVDLPAPFAHTGHVRAGGRWSLDLVVESDRPTVVSAWEVAMDNGVGHATVCLSDGTPGTLHFYDLRDMYGVTLLAVVPGAHDITIDPPSEPIEVTPRYGVAIRDQNGYVVHADDAVYRMLRCRPDHLVGVWALDVIHPEDHKRAIDNWIEVFSAEGAERRYRGRILTGDGEWLWIEFTNRLRTTDDGEIEIVSEMVDVSEEMAMHEALRRREEFLRRLTSALPVAVGQLDVDGNFVFANDRLNALLPPGGARRVDDLLGIVIPDHRPLLEDALTQVRTRGVATDVEVTTNPHGSGARVYRANFCALNDDDGVAGTLVTLTDVTESADLREALRKRATFDDLTGLHNRASIMALLGEALASGRDAGTGTAVVFIDLDDFKGVNDDFGHAMGDDVLVRVARRLRAAVRRNDLVGRIGGDEFLVVCPEVTEPAVAFDVAERVARHLAVELDVVGTSRRQRASIGVACSTDSSMPPEALIRAADAAMYESKRAGEGRPVLAELVR